MTKSSALLSIQGLCVRAQSADASAPLLLDNISLELQPGEVLGLIGESGAGKSTLGLAAMAYFRPGCQAVSGKVVFDGVELLAQPAAALRAMRGRQFAYVAQNPAASFNPAQRLGTQIAECLVLHHGRRWREARAEALQILAELDLPEPAGFAMRFPHQVSGGQLQRAMIAMAIACGPKLLVLDEPTTALDVTTQVSVLAAIRNTLRRRGMAALYISHDLAVVAQLADRMLVLQHGKRVEEAATKDLLARPAASYTRSLLHAFLAAAPCRRRSAPAAEPALQIDSVDAGYPGGQLVLQQLSLTLPRGRTLAIVGTSGSGKSTLARVICGLMPPQAGQVRFAGRALAGTSRQRSREESRKIQLIYQQPDTSLNPRQRVGQILGRVLDHYFQPSRKERQHRISELLQMVGLPASFSERFSWQLSGGQRQRVAIARALAARPELIVCDEVTSALDPVVADGILQLLARLQEDAGLSYVFITHDLGIVRRLADDVAVLRSGRLVDHGTVEAVFDQHPQSYTRLLASSVPVLRQGWLDSVLAQRPLAEAATHALGRERKADHAPAWSID